MDMSDETLKLQRRQAADASGGMSNDAIYRMALHCLARHDAKGEALDFGAGKGGFTRLLAESGRFARVSAVDLMARPASLPAAIGWLQADLNEAIDLPDGGFDTIAALEVIEHLENPRQFFRTAQRLLRPGGLLVLSTPNCQSIRSLVSLLVRGHFAAFGPDSYPAHITPLLLVDLERAAREAGLEPLGVSYSDSGAVPGFTAMSWQRLSLGTARGRRFSDNLAVVCRRA